MERIIYSAPFLWCKKNVLLKDSFIITEKNKIVDIRNSLSTDEKNDSKVINFRDAIILPGFINTHTHLNLSILKGKLRSTKYISRWFKKIILRTALMSTEKLNRSYEMGVKESIASGTTTIADITDLETAYSIMKKYGDRAILFYEVRGMKEDRYLPEIKKKKKILEKFPEDKLVKPGLSPHSPYSASQKLFDLSREIADKYNLKLHIHLSETKEEIEYIKFRKGKLYRLQQFFRFNDPNFAPQGVSPTKYLRRIGVFDRPLLLAHCNYLNDEDMEIIKASKSSVAFCPRSHSFFKHKSHPFKRLLSLGVNVALGTDSLASNCSLSILDELEFLKKQHPKVDNEVFLEMATINGAKALEQDDKIGTIEPNKCADFTVVRINNNVDDPLSEIFQDSSNVIATVVNNKILYSDSHFIT